MQGELVEGYGEPPPDPRHVANALLAGWVDHCADRPPDPVIRKQGRVAKRLASRYALEELAQAWAGIEDLYPYSEGAPWDLFDLERHFGKAFQLGTPVQPGAGPVDWSEWFN